MRRVVALAAVSLVTLSVAAVSNPSGASASTFPATQKTVIRPVTSSGVARAGFTVQAEPTGSVDCSFADPSPGAVNRNIEQCSPDSEYAIACWKAAAPHRVLCMRNPRQNELVRIPRTGAFASTPVAPVAERAPLVMRLADGDVCSIRIGGTFGSLPGHPNLFATYLCNHDGAVWAASTAAHHGVNESNPSWTVRTAQPGSHTIVTRHVLRAWFVGTSAA